MTTEGRSQAPDSSRPSERGGSRFFLSDGPRRSARAPRPRRAENRQTGKEHFFHRSATLAVGVPTWQQVLLTTKAFETEPGCSLFSADQHMLLSATAAACQR